MIIVNYHTDYMYSAFSGIFNSKKCVVNRPETGSCHDNDRKTKQQYEVGDKVVVFHRDGNTSGTLNDNHIMPPIKLFIGIPDQIKINRPAFYFRSDAGCQSFLQKNRAYQFIFIPRT